MVVPSPLGTMTVADAGLKKGGTSALYSNLTNAVRFHQQADVRPLSRGLIMADRMLQWFFGVALALVPVSFLIVSAYLSPNDPPIDVVKELRNGDLVLIACVMCSAGIGELLGSGSPNSKLVTRKIFCGSSSLLILILSAFAYSVMKRSSLVHEERALWFSVAMFVVGVIASGACVLLAAKCAHASGK